MCYLGPGRAARHIDDFLTDLANASKPRNTICAYRGDLTGFAAHHDGDIAGLTTAPVRVFLRGIAGQAPATRKRKRAALASFCRWAVRHELLKASPIECPHGQYQWPVTLEPRWRWNDHFKRMMGEHREQCGA
jgi:site-specific recombinase XerD